MPNTDNPDPALPSTPQPEPNPPDAAESSGTSPGYFNQAQLEDVSLAEDVVDAAGKAEYAARLAKEGIDAAFMARIKERLKQARALMTATGQSRDSSETATQHATGTEFALTTHLAGIQSAARQKLRLLADEDEPLITFSLEGYLIGERLNPNRAALLQNARALIDKATADALPGFDAARIQEVEAALEAYRTDESTQSSAQSGKESTRQQRDTLIRRLNTLRLSLQHAADRTWVYSDKRNRPVRKEFGLPLSRPLVK